MYGFKFGGGLDSAVTVAACNSLDLNVLGDGETEGRPGIRGPCKVE